MLQELVGKKNHCIAVAGALGKSRFFLLRSASMISDLTHVRGPPIPMLSSRFLHLRVLAVVSIAAGAVSAHSSVPPAPTNSATSQPMAAAAVGAQIVPMTRVSFEGIDYPRAADLNVGRASQRLPRRRARERARRKRTSGSSFLIFPLYS